MTAISKASLLLTALLALAPLSLATVYDVGPGQPLAGVGDVPWESLLPGDTVQIHWRATPYKEKWVICRQGTAAAPITVRGIAGPGGALPVIDGNGATTRLALDYTSEQRGVVKIGTASVPPDTMPKYITLENLEIRGARSTYSFADDNGANQSYTANASTIYLEKGENITIRNCILHDAGNCFFVASSDTDVSRNILVEGSYIYGCGNNGSITEHNVYVAGIGMVFQYNHLGPLLAGAGGNNLKDRSSGLVVRYNWIEGGNRQLDLVHAEDSVVIRTDPAYHATHVYGNVLIENAGTDNRQMIHYGGDGGSQGAWRKGTLYLYANTFISKRTDRTTMVRLSSNGEGCDARDNIVYATAAGTTVSLLDTDGVLFLTHNWFKPGYVVSFGSFHGTVTDDGTSVTGASPGFANEAAQDYRLAGGSSCINAGAALLPAVLPANDVVQQYVPHQAFEPRPHDATIDIGAFEGCSALVPSGPVTGLLFGANRATLTWTALASADRYDVAKGDLASLFASHGDFTASTLACLENDGADTLATDASTPAAGGGFWYAVRGATCNATGGTYNEPGASQSGLRDAEIQASPLACP